MLRKSFEFCLWLAVLVAIVLSIAPQLFRSVWYWDLFSHFYLQYFVGSMILCGLFLALRSVKGCLVSGLLCVFLSYPVLSWFIPQNSWDIRPFENAQATMSVPSKGESHLQLDVVASSKKASDTGRVKPLTVVLSNVLMLNDDYSKLLDLVREEKPDVLVVQELTPQWLSAIREPLDDYPYYFGQVREDSFGMGVFSRFPLVSPQLHYFSQSSLPSIATKVNVEGVLVDVLSIHPPPPLDRDMYAVRNGIYRDVSAYIAKHYCRHGLPVNDAIFDEAVDPQPCENPFLLIGDFNSTMWSPAYQNYIATLPLSNIRVGRGVMPSWPSKLFHFGIPIDHCLVSSHFDVLGAKLGKSVGSDHFPLVISLAF